MNITGTRIVKPIIKGYNNGFGYRPTCYNPTGVKEFCSETEFKEILKEQMEEQKKGVAKNDMENY